MKKEKGCASLVNRFLGKATFSGTAGSWTEQRTVNQQLMRLSQEIGIDLVATNDVHYTYAEDEKPHDILLCLQTGKSSQTRIGCLGEGGQYYEVQRRDGRTFPICTGGAGKHTEDCRQTLA